MGWATCMVGLRYAYEAGYDITKGPELWRKFAKKYGEGSATLNFFFSNHSLAATRADHLETEIAHNYPDGPKKDGPPRPPSPNAPTSAGGETPMLAAAPVPTQVEPGMTPDEVRAILGDPDNALVFGERLRWTYETQTIVFEEGVVTEIRE